MRIGIESSHFTVPLAGIGHYLYHLLWELSRLEGDEEYLLLYNRPLVPLALPSRMKHALCGPKSTHLWAQTRLSGLCRRHGVDVLHSPGQCIPLARGGKSVLTVHDLSPLLFPAQKDRSARFVWTQLVPRMARKADHIITVSDHTKRDVVNLLGIPETRITRIYEAASADYFPEPDRDKLDAFRRERGLGNGYALAVSTLEPRKNYPFLLRVFARWTERSNPGATLVIVGKKGWLYDDIFRTAERLNLGDRVRFLGYVEGAETMRMYYAAAEFLAMTPLYEGFWLPGLEALACGTPAVAPNHSSIAEIIGGAGMLVDGWDECDWADAMDRMWKRADRDAWSARGIERAKEFSWKKAARETLEVYRRVAGGGGEA